MKKTLLSTIFAFCTLLIFAQEQTQSPKKREIGLTGVSFSGGAFVIKKEIKENSYQRVSFNLGNFNFNKGQTLKQTDIDFGILWGKEKRKNLVSQLNFIHGFQYGVNSRFDNDKSTKSVSFDFVDTRINIQAELGYLIGFIYHLNEKIYIGVESIPKVGAGFSYHKNNDKKIIVSFDNIRIQSSGYFQLTAVYKL